jgi:hypothetical protein
MRRHIITIFLFPVAAFMWLIGWALFYTSSKQVERRPHDSEATAKEDTLEITTIIDEENYAVADS